MEQQRVIRRLLRKNQPDQGKHNWSADEREGVDYNSDPEMNDPEDESEIANDDPPIEISISVPDLTEMCLARPPEFRSVSENEEKEKNRSLRLKMERRAKNREKLMSMKRYSGFLKRPEILETVYSVEEDGTEGTKVTEGESTKPVEKEEDKEEGKGGNEEVERRESETTEYDYSTDDESLRMIFSETDQSNTCSEICSRRSSSGSQPAIHRLGREEEESKARSMEDLRGKMRLIGRRKKFLLHNQSVSLDCGDN